MQYHFFSSHLLVGKITCELANVQYIFFLHLCEKRKSIMSPQMCNIISFLLICEWKNNMQASEWKNHLWARKCALSFLFLKTMWEKKNFYEHTSVQYHFFFSFLFRFIFIGLKFSIICIFFFIK
jgi:hypothetical protein